MKTLSQVISDTSWLIGQVKILIKKLKDMERDKSLSIGGISIDTSFTLVPYNSTLSVVHNKEQPNFEIYLIGNLDLNLTGTSNGDSGIVNLYFSGTQTATLNGLIDLSVIGASAMIPVLFSHDSDGLRWSTDTEIPLKIYANDAAADADVTLLSGKYYKLTGSRVIYQKP